MSYERAWYAGISGTHFEVVSADSFLLMRQYANSDRELLGEYSTKEEAEAEAKTERALIKTDWEYRVANGFEDPYPDVDVWVSPATDCTVPIDLIGNHAVA